MTLTVHGSEASLIKHDHSVKMFEYRGTKYVYDEWLLNKMNSMFGGSATACYTPRLTPFKTNMISHLEFFLFFADRPPTRVAVSEWLMLDRLAP